MNEKVQIAEGATLTLAPGTKILGNPNAYFASVEVFGELRTTSGGDRAVLANVAITLEGNSKATSSGNRVVLDNALLYGARVSDNNSFGGSLTLVNSELHRTAIYGVDLDSLTVSHSALVDSPLSVYSYHDGAVIKDSLLIQSSSLAAALTVWASFGAPVVLDGSTVIVRSQAAIRLTSEGGVDGAGVSGRGNYIRSSTLPESDLIIDRNDDLHLKGVVQLSGALNAYSPTAPKPEDVLTVAELGRVLPWGANTIRTNGTMGNDVIVVSEGDTEIVDGKAGTDVFVRGLLSSLVTITGDAHERHIYDTANLYNHPTTHHRCRADPVHRQIGGF